jgi:hypothetical protein
MKKKTKKKKKALRNNSVKVLEEEVERDLRTVENYLILAGDSIQEFTLVDFSLKEFELEAAASRISNASEFLTRARAKWETILLKTKKKK